MPRIGILSAFEPEWEALHDVLTDVETQTVNGIPTAIGRLEGRDVIVMMCGMSMVNAAMTAQLMIDRFAPQCLLMSGIAGSVDPALNIGDVVIPRRWAQSLEVIMGREVADGFSAPGWLTWKADLPGFGMMLPNRVIVGSAEPKLWFDADADLFAIAAAMEGIALRDHTADGQALHHMPQVHAGGSAVSGPAFVDNAAYRDYLASAFGARVADMESAAVAHVAFANAIPFLAFRSVSDLAGAGGDSNEMLTFMRLAAENSVRVISQFLKAFPA
ncbi:5'-methylthioadenosine/S-adenosylhomocysteine nucleosidase [Asticcacaulis solisilvae]|uniref:5'-methylthioadenosine/S-adenosylhomocysteine nucleosidase n=1 Tax=Asticcacaulis solisilvae TaxID=1217274 RepID=UPI003FD6D9C0